MTASLTAKLPNVIRIGMRGSI